MTEDKKHQLDEIAVTDIVSYLGTRLSSMEEHIRRKDKCIKELEKKNAELKSIADFQTSSNMDRYFQLKRSKEQLTKAKEVITNLVKFDASYKDDEECQRKNELYDKIWEEAEQFLKKLNK